MLQSFESQIWKKSKTGKVCGELSHVQPSQKAKKQQASSLRKKRKALKPGWSFAKYNGGQNMLPVYVSRPPGSQPESPWSLVEPPICICLSLKATWGNHYLSNLSHLSWNSLCRNFAPFTIYHPKGRSDISIQKSTFYQGQCVTRPRPDQDFFETKFSNVQINFEIDTETF